MRVVILGGTGNISTSIVRLLLEKGHEVACFNRGTSGKLPADVRHIQGDRMDRSRFEETMQRERFDAAIDMICATPEDAASSIAAFRGVRHFIPCSTTATYGRNFKWLPVSEDHPLAPITEYGRGKELADRLYLEAYYREQFPVTIIKPHSTYGPKSGILRQVAYDFSWIDRIRKGKPILLCGDGQGLCQFLHVDDAAMGFVGVLGRDDCAGQMYNLVNQGFATWEGYHRTAMKVLGGEVELIGVTLNDLLSIDESRFSFCRDFFFENSYFSSEKIFRDIPDFRPAISLEEGMRRVFEVMEKEGRIPDSDLECWEDRIIDAQSLVKKVML
ncbi:MAG: NAD-dependent epimerase/dehydratase family protein [Candidatus Latescibacterota bacterium]